MWDFFGILSLAALVQCSAAAATVANNTGFDPSPRIDFDAIVIGGGPAGLATLSGLARVRRKVLLVDSGEYRNGATRHQHDVPGVDGLAPSYYRWLARKQLGHYGTVTMTNGTITEVRPEKNNTYFTVWGKYPDDKEIAYTARKIVLATGVKDQLPETPGLRENFGNGIFWCPWCDGHEHADQQLGIISTIIKVPGTVSEVASLNTDIIAFTNGTLASDTALTETEAAFPRWRDYLESKGVLVDDRTIKEIERLRNGSDLHADPSLPTYPERDLFRIHFETGEPKLRNAFVVNFGIAQASKLPQDVGIELADGKIKVDGAKGLATSVPGIYAVGDCNNGGPTNVPYALFSGKRASVFLHVQLERENTAQLLARSDQTGSIGEGSATKAHAKARALWDEVNGQPGDFLYAGDFDQY